MIPVIFAWAKLITEYMKKPLKSDFFLSFKNVSENSFIISRLCTNTLENPTLKECTY